MFLHSTRVCVFVCVSKSGPGTSFRPFMDRNEAGASAPPPHRLIIKHLYSLGAALALIFIFGLFLLHSIVMFFTAAEKPQTKRERKLFPAVNHPKVRNSISLLVAPFHLKLFLLVKPLGKYPWNDASFSLCLTSLIIFPSKSICSRFCNHCHWSKIFGFFFLLLASLSYFQP